jgi:hypothetical protein
LLLLVVLQIDLRVSCLLCRNYTTLDRHSCFTHCVYVCSGLDYDPSFYAFHIAGVISACHHTELLGEMESCENFPRQASNHGPPNLHLWSTWGYRCEPMHLAIIIDIIY